MMADTSSCPARRTVFAAVYIGAMAWPWGAYQQVFHGYGVFDLALSTLFLALALSWVRHGRPNIPFDLLWPALLLLCGAAVCWTAGDRLAAQGILGGGIAFLLAHFGATNQTLVFRALAVSVLSAGCVAFLTLLAEYNFVFPTFFAHQGAAVGAGPTCLEEALLLFSWSFIAAFGVILGRRSLLWKGVAWLLPLAGLFCALAFYVIARRLRGELSAWSPNYTVLAFPTLPMALLGLYLASRVAARVFLLASPDFPSSRKLLGLILLAFALLLVFVGEIPSPGLCFCFGLVGALGVQRTLRSTEPLTIAWASLVVFPVLIVHAFFLFPGDARDYVSQVQRIRRAQGAQGAHDFLSLLLRRFPGESRARLELAKMELERGEIDAAVDGFIVALRESRASHIWDKPGPADVDAFLAQVRLKSANMTGISLEGCLAGAGKAQEAVSVLKSRITPGPDANIAPEILRRALSALLGGQETASYLGHWTASEMLAGLNLCGNPVQSVQAPADIPRRYLPAVLTARALRDGRMVTVFYPGGQMGRSWCMPRCTGETPGEGETWWLDPVLDGETGEWFVPLAGAADVTLGNEMRISLIEDARSDCGPGAGGWAVMCLLP